MGGPGSGNRWRYQAKSTTDEYRSFDVRCLARHGRLKPGYCGSWKWTHDGATIKVQSECERVILTYRHRRGGEEWRNKQYSVRLVRTRCHFGGSRVWFICPAHGCGRRVAILYGGDIFACRHCYRLAYASSRQDAADRAATRAEGVRARLGWGDGILNGEASKPKWMRWRTFNRLAAEHNRFVTRSIKALATKVGSLEAISRLEADAHRGTYTPVCRGHAGPRSKI
jgi:hypothetical protein